VGHDDGERSIGVRALEVDDHEPFTVDGLEHSAILHQSGSGSAASPTVFTSGAARAGPVCF
jgi:hypothetical protein